MLVQPRLGGHDVPVFRRREDEYNNNSVGRYNEHNVVCCCMHSSRLGGGGSRKKKNAANGKTQLPCKYYFIISAALSAVVRVFSPHQTIDPNVVLLFCLFRVVVAGVITAGRVLCSLQCTNKMSLYAHK